MPGCSAANVLGSSVRLAVATGKVLLDLLRERKEDRHKPQADAENRGPLVRRELERARAAHNGRRARGG
jgi:hypothetical protein